MKDLLNFKDRVSVATGGSKGIGETITSGFTGNGVKTRVSFRNADACDATGARLSEPGDCVSIPADLSSTEGIHHLADELGMREDKRDILVKNAGANWGEPIEDFGRVAGIRSCRSISRRLSF